MAATSRNATTILGMFARSLAIPAVMTVCAYATLASLCLERRDLLPQAGILLLVGGPDLFLRHLAERRHIGLDHGHALGFELLLGRSEVVDRFGELADLVLG